MTDRLSDFDGVAIGAELPVLVKRPTALHLFRFSAVTWNAHRIHYEPAYARSEGHADILVQAHLHGAYLTQLVLDWAPAAARMTRMGWKNRRPAVPGDELTCHGQVVGKSVSADAVTLELALRETNQRGELCAEGFATLALAGAVSGAAATAGHAAAPAPGAAT